MTDSIPPLEPVDPEDTKLITLARSSRARNSAEEGAAVRDEIGRTYVATTVALPSLRLSALRAAVAIAVSSGTQSLRSAVVVGEGEELPEEDAAVVRDLRIPQVLLVAPDGTPTRAVRA